MLYQQIGCFLRVAELGSFSKAAKELFLSPQALMKQVGLLEARLGGKLLERSARGVKLTPFGSAALPKLAKLRRESDETVDALRREAAGGDKTVKIGIFSALPKEQMITPFVTFLLGHFPSYHLGLELMTGEEGRQKLESGQIDLLLTHIHEEERWDGFERLVFQSFPAQVCVSLMHAWTMKDKVTREDLAGETLIRLQPERPVYAVPRNESFYETIPCKNAVNVRNFDTMVALLEQGGAFAVFPMFFSNMEHMHYKAFPYPGRQLLFYMCLVSRPDRRGEAAEAIIQAAREEYGLWEL